MESAKRMFEVRSQAKESSQQTLSEFQDLNNWEDEIRAKDNQLRGVPETSKPKKTQKKCRKAVRERQVVESLAAAEHKRSTATNYDKWAKFSSDIDGELKKVDKSIVYCSSDCECDRDGNDDDADKQARQTRLLEQQKEAQRAALENDKGNAYMTKGKYAEAVKCYTDGIEFDPNSAVLLGNRAQALLKLKKYSAAESDCSKALSLDADYAKAYYRRGSARLQLENFIGAKEDFEAVLQRDPKNVDAVNLLRCAVQRMQLNDKTGEVAEMPNISEHLRSESDETIKVPVKLVSSGGAAAGNSNGKQSLVVEEINDDSHPPPSSSTTNGHVAKDAPIDKKKADTAKSEFVTKTSAAAVKEESSSIPKQAPPKAAAAPQNKLPDGPAPPPKPYFDKATLKRPTTIQEWLSAMNKINGNVELIQFYCRQVTYIENPSRLYQELGTGLDNQLFARLIDAYEQLVDADEKIDCYAHLCGLSHTARVRSLCYLMPKAMKQRFASLLRSLLETEDWMEPPEPASKAEASERKNIKEFKEEEEKKRTYGPYNAANERADRKRATIFGMYDTFYLEKFKPVPE